MKKIYSNKGETLVETLASIVIVLITILFLSTSAITAAKINAKLRQVDFSFSYESTPTNGTVQVTEGAAADDIPVDMFENEGFTYYTYRARAGGGS